MVSDNFISYLLHLSVKSKREEGRDMPVVNASLYIINLSQERDLAFRLPSSPKLKFLQCLLPS